MSVMSLPIIQQFLKKKYKAKNDLPIPVAAQSKARLCGRSLAEVVVSNPSGGMNVCLLWVSCVVKYRSLQRADPLPRAVLLGVCVFVCA